MNEVDRFLQDSSNQTGQTVDQLIANILHIRDATFASIVAEMEAPVGDLALRVDHEIRLRNPGLHYVVRKMYVGYRREGNWSSPHGERSQIFASLIRNRSRLEIVLPVNPDTIKTSMLAQDLRGKGHHGIGDVRVTLSTDSEVDQFLDDFDHWLRPTR